MNEYTFFIDRKVTMWIREQHCINAESEEKAKEIMIKNVEDSNTDATFIGQEWLDDTITDMQKEDNLNNPVVELYSEKMELLKEE